MPVRNHHYPGSDELVMDHVKKTVSYKINLVIVGRSTPDEKESHIDQIRRTYRHNHPQERQLCYFISSELCLLTKLIFS